ncbi:hypothetical protein PG991_005969 [Apiospora marii]|uniref:SH3 domain-containing protein n=1 Tax=Apiospora marii TaxID=335849 RepID=A0ABR1SAQ9_9PEZI
MTDEVERLILAPFKEIVEKANVAIANAEGADDDVAAPMLKAAQSLAKEGERALTRIEPLCAKNHEQYGTNFVDAVKEHDEIAQYRAELEDLLWDFDDYVEADEFAADKFDELQKTSRKAAPRLMDILKRMKLVEPATPSLRSPTSPSFENPFSINRSSLPPGEEPQVVVQPPLVSPNDRSMDEVEQQLSLMMKPQAVPVGGIRTPGSASDLDRSNSHRSEISTTPSEPPPPPPTINPWQVGQPPPPFGSDGQLEDGGIPERRPVVSADDSPTLPAAVPVVSPRAQQEGHRRHRSQHSVINEDAAQSDDEATQRLSSSSPVDMESGYGQIMPMRSASIAGHRVRANSAGQGGLGRTDIRRTSAQSSASSSWSSRPPSAGSVHYIKSPPMIEHSRVTYAPTGYPPRITSLAEPKGHTMRQPSADSISSSIFDCVPYDDLPSPGHDTLRSPASPHSPYDYHGNRPPSYATVAPKYRHHMAPNERPMTVISDTSTLTSLVPPPLGPLPPQPRSRTRSFREQNQQPREFEQQQLQPPPQQLQIEAGLERANTPGQRRDDPGIIPVETEAHEEIGPMPSRKPDCNIGPHSSFYQLKGFCKGAEEVVSGGLGFKKIKRPVGSVEKDVKNDSTGNYTSKRLDGILQPEATVCPHGTSPPPPSRCVWLHRGRGEEIPPHLKDNSDLWFPHPPTTSVMPAIALEVGRLPTAVATETRKLTHGILRSPPDRAPVLEYAIGARIVGIEFPARYEGKWAMGWHDGVRGVFESDTVKLEPPSRSEVRMQGNSNMQAVARWKFRQSGGEGKWLKLNKGDVIENISCDHPSPNTGAYTDHWCWSGTSSKHWGIFPQTHVDPASVQELPSGGAGTRDGSGNSIASAEKKSTMASLFSIRKTNNTTTADRKLFSRAGNEPSGPRLVID